MAVACAIAAMGVLLVGNTSRANGLHRAFTRGFEVSLAAQVLIGVLLHLRYSPYTAGVRANVEVVVRDPTLRYWNALHPLIGTLPLAAMVGGRLFARRSGSPTAQRRRMRSALVAAALLTLAAFPWAARLARLGP